jgi:asparagine synthase (glutamine-hydrolysing)
MFAFAIYDKLEKTLFLARDRAGKKPLYFYNDGSKFFFSSELNCIKNTLSVEINNENFLHYFHLGFFYKDFTPYKNVNKLEAGSYAIINCNTLDVSIKKWWNAHDFYLKNNNDSFNQALEKTNSYLREGVKRRIVSSDLEVGCFLSGGIDSGLVTSIASEYSNRLKTITVSFDDAYDEYQPTFKLDAINSSNKLYADYAGSGKTHFIINELIPTLDDFIVLSPSHASIREYRSKKINCNVIQNN